MSKAHIYTVSSYRPEDQHKADKQPVAVSAEYGLEETKRLVSFIQQKWTYYIQVHDHEGRMVAEYPPVGYFGDFHNTGFETQGD